MSWPSPTTADLATAECGGGVCLVVDMDNNAWRTGDQGDHWELAPLPALSGSRSGVTYGWGALATTLRYLDGRWFLGGRSRIYVSDDALRWTSVYDNPSIVNGYGHEVQLYGVGRVGDTVVFGSVGEGYLYTFLSLDGGDTWPTVTQASSSSMPGVGTNCASLPVVSDGSAFWALGWSYCDSIPYNTADAWRSAPGSVLSWSNQTPTGLFEQGMGVGSTDDGDVLFIGSSSSNGPHTCDRWVLYEDGVATTGSIGVADATCSYSYFGSLHPVAFDGNWYVPASGIGGASMMVVSGDARSWRAVDPGFEVADVTRFE
jgi:hypothetical protein